MYQKQIVHTRTAYDGQPQRAAVRSAAKQTASVTMRSLMMLMFAYVIVTTAAGQRQLALRPAGDSKTAQRPFCSWIFQDYCQRCKCKACSFCTSAAAAVAPAAAASKMPSGPAGGMRPPLPDLFLQRRRRPRARPASGCALVPPPPVRRRATAAAAATPRAPTPKVWRAQPRRQFKR